MNIRNALHLSTVAVVLAGGTSLMAQVTTGALNGSVTDELGNPIVGARVVLESPALFQPRVYSTNDKGEYRALLLPVGNYVIKVSASGKLSKTASDVRVGVGTNLSMPFQLRAQKTTESATVEVVSTQAAESKTNDKVSVNYSAEQLTQLPVGLTFQDAMQLAPGVSGYGTSAQIRGSGNNQIMYRIDGINVQDSSAGGSLYTPLPDSIEDVQVVLSALNARNGLVQGGQMNMVTKSGSNTLEGSIRSYVYRNAWGADITHQTVSDNSAAKNEDYSRILDVTLSGPIVPDRVWFYVGARFEPSTPNTNYLAATYHAQANVGHPNPRWANSPVSWDNLYGANAYSIGGNSFNGVGSNGATYLPGLKRGIIAPMATYGMDPGVDAVVYTGPSYGTAGSPYATNFGMNGVLQDSGAVVATSNKHSHIEGKFTGMITDAHVLSFTYLFDKTTIGNSMGEHSSNAQQMAKASWVGDTDTTIKGWTLNWNGTLASNWTVEARVSSAKNNATDLPNPPGNRVSLQAYWATTEPTLPLWQDSASLSDHSYVHGQSQTLDLGPLEEHLSQYNHPQTKGNQTYTVNFKTFQEFLGQHEIDFGAERLSTVWNFGRSKDGSRQVFCGGLYNIPGGGVSTELYPVFRRGDGAEVLNRAYLTTGANYPGTLIPTPVSQTDLWEASTGVNLVANEPYNHSWDAASGLRSTSAHMEHYFINAGDSKNSTNSFWINDIYTINNQWNMLVGFRLNDLKMDDGGTGGPKSSISEPRIQVKYNPDGKNKNVYSFSIAKLASAYSDQVANLFRGDEWDVRTVKRWTGANLAAAQPGFDTPQGQQDNTLSGNYNGYTYQAGTNYHGVRFVNYDAVIDAKNYGGTSAIFNNRMNNITHDFKAPYTIEYNLGYTRNYDTGSFKINAVDRVYKDAWVLGWRDYGTPYMVEMNSPDPTDVGAKAFNVNAGTINYSNSQNDQNYISLEINFDKKLSSRLTMGGSYTWAQMTGVNDTDYYNYKSLREQLLNAQQRSAAVGDGYLQKINTAHMWLTYVHPVGKGNVSFSLRGDSYEQGATASVVGYSNYANVANTKTKFDAITKTITDKYGPLGDQVMPIDGRNGQYAGVTRTTFATYYGKMGDFKNGIDYYNGTFRVQADIPIGLGKTRLVSYISIQNLFNHGILTNVYELLNNNGSNRGTEAWGGGQIGGPSGRVTASFLRAYGQAGADSANYGNGGDGGARYTRSGDFSIGLKF